MPRGRLRQRQRRGSTGGSARPSSSCRDASSAASVTVPVDYARPQRRHDPAHRQPQRGDRPGPAEQGAAGPQPRRSRRQRHELPALRDVPGRRVEEAQRGATTSSVTHRAESAAPPLSTARTRREHGHGPGPLAARTPPPRSSGGCGRGPRRTRTACARRPGRPARPLHHPRQRPRPRRAPRRPWAAGSSTSSASPTAATSAPSTPRSSPATYAASSSTASSTRAPARSGTRTNLDQNPAFERRWTDWKRWVARHDSVYGLGRTPTRRAARRSTSVRDTVDRGRVGGSGGPRRGLEAAARRVPRRRRTTTPPGPGTPPPSREFRKGDPQPLLAPGRSRSGDGDRARRTATPSTTPCSAPTRPGRATGHAGTATTPRLARHAPFKTWENVWMNLPCAYWQRQAGQPRGRAHRSPARSRPCCSSRPTRDARDAVRGRAGDAAAAGRLLAGHREGRGHARRRRRQRVRRPARRARTCWRARRPGRAAECARASRAASRVPPANAPASGRRSPGGPRVAAQATRTTPGRPLRPARPPAPRPACAAPCRTAPLRARASAPPSRAGGA